MPTLRKYLNSENSEHPRNQKPKQVLYVWNYLEWGGAQVYHLGIAARIRDRVKVRFIFPEETSEQFKTFCDKRGLEYECLGFFADWSAPQTFGAKVRRHFDKFRTEIATVRHLLRLDLEDTVIHIDLAPWQSVLALAMLSRRARVFVTMHNALPAVAPWRAFLWRLKFRFITSFSGFNIFASNEDAKKSLAEWAPAEFVRDVAVTYTNVNPDETDAARSAEFDRPATRRRFGIPESAFLVLCLGQFIDRKGRWTFLEAARRVAEIASDIVFVWVTNSVIGEADRARIEEYGISDRFFLIDSDAAGENHLELMKFLRCADVFTLPSFVEGLPISLLEAMSLGIPSISTRVYAIPEAVVHEKTGLLIDAGDDQALADAVLRLRDDPELRSELAANGREFVNERFNEKVVAEIALRKYREAFDR